MIAPGNMFQRLVFRAACVAVATGVVFVGSSQAQSGGWRTTTTPADQANAKSKRKSQASKRRTAEKPKPNKKAAAAESKSSGNGGGAKLDAAAAQQKVEAGIRAINAGKHASAVTDISAAIDAGSLPSTQTARALYYRGIAYRGLSKSALAIADLTSALWLKKGLDPEQRKDALAQRAGAYREAGVSEKSAPDVAARSGETKEPSSGARDSTQITSSGTGFGQLLTSWMGGGNTSTSSIAKTPSPESKPAPAAAPVTSSWGAATKVVPNTSEARPVPVASGRQYGIQVAAVRSPQEAQAVATRVQQRFGAQLNGRAPLVEQTDAGNAGTVYKVRVGPFASANEPSALCEQIKSEGMACVVVMQ